MIRTWAQVDSSGLCLNTLLLDPDDAPDYPRDGLIDITNQNPTPGIGWTFNESGWIAPPEPAP